MNISEHLQKDYWKRRVNPDAMTVQFPSMAEHYRQPLPNDFGEAYRYLTQADFLAEIEPTAHSINSRYQSTRPIRELVEQKDENGNVTGKEWQVVGYDDLETVRYGLQKRLAINKTSHFSADGFWISNETKDRERFTQLLSWKDSSGLDIAWRELVKSCFNTGDGAIYLYQLGDRIEYKVFSYLYGDTLYPEYDGNRNPILYREYTLNGQRAVDIYSTNSIETWVLYDPENSLHQKWYSRVSGWFAKGFNWKTAVVSEDGWRRIYKKDTQISNDLNQCVYWRIPDIPSGPAQADIEALERAASYIAEEVKATAFPELFIKAAKITDLPPIGSHGRTIGVKGDVEQVKASDAKFLTPPDASNIATIDLKNKMESILRTTSSVFVDPEILKSGSDSSTTVQMLFYPEQQWCHNMWPTFAPQLRYLIEVFKALVAKIESDGEYTKLRTSCGINIWLPKNMTEKVDYVTKLVYAGIISKENARVECDLQYVDDADLVRRESDDDLYNKAFVPLKAQADAEKQFGVSSSDIGEDSVSASGEPQANVNADSPYAPDIDTGEPGIDKNASRRNILN